MGTLGEAIKELVDTTFEIGKTMNDGKEDQFNGTAAGQQAALYRGVFNGTNADEHADSYRKIYLTYRDTILMSKSGSWLKDKDISVQFGFGVHSAFLHLSFFYDKSIDIYNELSQNISLPDDAPELNLTPKLLKSIYQVFFHVAPEEDKPQIQNTLNHYQERLKPLPVVAATNPVSSGILPNINRDGLDNLLKALRGTISNVMVSNNPDQEKRINYAFDRYITTDKVMSILTAVGSIAVATNPTAPNTTDSNTTTSNSASSKTSNTTSWIDESE